MEGVMTTRSWEKQSCLREMLGRGRRSTGFDCSSCPTPPRPPSPVLPHSPPPSFTTSLLWLRWLTTVLMEYKSTTFNSFEKGSKLFFPSLTYCLFKSFTILCEIWTIALFTVSFSHLHCNLIQRGCEAISGLNYHIARNCHTHARFHCNANKQG